MNNSQTLQTPKSISDLKAKARGTFLRNIGPGILSSLIFLSISFCISSIVAMATSGSGILSFVMYYILGILSAAVTEILRYGICYLFLQSSCNQKIQINDIFFAFKERTGRILPAAFLLGSFSFLCLMPFNIYSYMVASNTYVQPANNYLQAALAIMGLTIFYILNIAFSMTHYLLIDFPDMSSIDAMKMSVWLMKGHKLRFFLLLLSFLPLQLLGLLSCGIGFIFIYPYIYSAEACFYLNLTSIKSQP